MASFQYGGLVEQIATTATAAGTTTLTNISKQIQVFTGSTTQTIVLPAATTMSVGQKFEIYNQSTGALTLQFNGGGSFTDAASVGYGTIVSNNTIKIELLTNSTSPGTWAVSLSGNAALTNPMSAAGQLIYGGTGGAPTALAAGTSGQILKSNGTSAPAFINNGNWMGTTTISSTTSLTSANLGYNLLLNTSAITVTMPTGVPAGSVIGTYNNSSGEVGLSAGNFNAGGLNGATTFRLWPNQAYTWVYDGTSWNAVGAVSAQGTFTAVSSGATNCVLSGSPSMSWVQNGNVVTVWGTQTVSSVTASSSVSFNMTVPVMGSNNFGSSLSQGVGSTNENGADQSRHGPVVILPSTQTVQVRFQSSASNTGADTQYFNFTYTIP
jgi:hypothetical protein